MSGSNILNFAFLPIGGKREKTAFQILKKHSKTVAKSMEEFKGAITAYFEGKLDEGREIVRGLDQLESTADRIGERFEGGLGAGAFLPAFRGELSRLDERVDDVIDLAEETVRGIYLRPKLLEDLAKAEEKNSDAKNLRKGLVNLASKAVDSAKALDEGVSILMENMDAAVARAEEVHTCEAKSDKAEEELIKKLYKYEDLLPPLTVIQVKDIIVQIGRISDVAEDAGDIISVMCVALKA